jgi:hypothetical protein
MGSLQFDVEGNAVYASVRFGVMVDNNFVEYDSIDLQWDQSQVVANLDPAEIAALLTIRDKVTDAAVAEFTA